MSVSKIVAAAASGVGGAGLDVDEVFDTFLYTSTGSTISVNNGIDLSGEGGLVWFKGRNTTREHFLYDTERGTGKALAAAQDNSQFDIANALTAFNSNGFNIGTYDSVNSSDVTTQVAWTFRKAEKFFDVVTYTGNSTNRTISHNLGSVPGMMLIKKTSGTGNWMVYHRGANGGTNPEQYYGKLNDVDAFSTLASAWNNTAPTSSVFSLGDQIHVNENGSTYVAYLFAHNNNDGEFGSAQDQDIIKCGYYNGNGTTDGSNKITLGFEPQFVFLKRSDGGAYYSQIIDSMRGMVSGGNDQIIWGNVNSAENGTLNSVDATATGFSVNDSGNSNLNGSTWIYTAIRRGPLAVPDDATKVFSVLTGDGNGDSTTPQFASGFPVDMALIRSPSGTANNNIYTRLTANKYISTNSSAAEVTDATDFSFAANTGWYLGSTTWTSWMWKRAPSYFDVSTYTGTGSARTVSHNLGAVPEMIWVKCRSHAESWVIYHKNMDGSAPEDYGSYLDDSVGRVDSANFWNDTAPTSSVFTVGTASKTNGSSQDYIAMLFASVEGVSKLGGYTGNGSTQTINCGFAPRLIMIKKAINGNGGFMLFDTLRGIVAGNDPYLLLYTTDAQNFGADTIDPHATGFTVNDGNTNANTDGYIFYAIA